MKNGLAALIVTTTLFGMGLGYFLETRSFLETNFYQNQNLQRAPATPIQGGLFSQHVGTAATAIDQPVSANESLATSAGDEYLRQLPSEELSIRLIGENVRMSEMTLEEIDRHIATADALIEKDPNSYRAYKSKLLGLLIKEVKFKTPVSPDIYNELYDELLAFDILNEEDRIRIEAQILRGEENIPSPDDVLSVDNDLIHIPFLRLSAMHDFEGLLNASGEYIENFPDSYVGYLYYAEALWRLGGEGAAFNVLQEGLKKQNKEYLLIRMFSYLQTDQLDRLYRMVL